MSDTVTAGTLVTELYRDVARVRAAELFLQEYIEEHGFGGFWHPGLGQEGLQVGAVHALRRDDYLFQAHRGLGYALAKGLSFEKIFADLLGRTTGTTGGKGGGTVHFVDPALGILGQGGTIGSAFPLGVGAAISTRILGEDRVVAIFFGEGAAARGTLYEAALEAGVWKLPVIFVCENNGWAISASFARHSPTPRVADRAAAFGFPGVVVDGQDAVAVYEATCAAVERARAGEGPTLIEAMTLRLRGHFEGDRQRYRPADEATGIDPARTRDPVDVLRDRLDPGECDAIDAAAQAEVERAFQAALAAPEADNSVAFQDVWA
jgi:acetoin:2,6-dichlorophenolindophenol oxidoreductase subunit alpha